MYNRELLLKEYEKYNKSEESFIVSLIKIHAKNLDTTTKWIHVVEYDCWRWIDEKPCFNYIIIELFNRMIKPKYPANADSSLRRAITWEVCHEDIDKQKALGIKGPLFLVTCSLIDVNYGKKVLKSFDNWNEDYGGFDHTGKVPTTTITKEVNMEPKRNYKITGLKQIDNQRLLFIQENYKSIYARINEERKVKIDWFLGK